MYKRSIQLGLLAFALWSSSAFAAEHEEVINGATCVPYPPYGNAAVAAVPYQHWLYGFGQSAFCHLTMSDEWQVNSLNYVLFSGLTNAGSLTARLCLHSGDSTVTCGPTRSISGPSLSVNWVPMPTTIPPFATGAFVQITFPPGTVSVLYQLIPVWIK
jgi:hypothetical protein